MIKRCMSVGLALSMLLSLTPITAIHADEVDVNETQVLEVQENLDDVKKLLQLHLKMWGKSLMMIMKITHFGETSILRTLRENRFHI